MRAHHGFLISAAIAVLITPALAASPTPLSFRGAQNSAYQCSAAAAAAETRASASNEELAMCTTAIDLAADSKGERAAALNNRAVMHLERAEYDATIADTTAALEIVAKLPEALVNRGVAQMLAGRPKDAVNDLTRGLELGPEHPERVYFNRGMAHEDAGDLVGAYLDYRKASQLDPTWDRPKKELMRFTVVQKTPTS